MSCSLAPWWVVVPVRGAPGGKSRLDGATGAHAIVTRAIARDTLAAVAQAVGAARTILVCSDSALVDESPYVVVPDPAEGLDGAVAAGVAVAAATSPGTPVAALLGDLPALRAKDLATALAAAARHERAAVPDRSGRGTVLVTARGGRLPTRFGSGSAARHAALGYAVLTLDVPRLRLDVDTAQDLADALRIGCGRHTADAMASLAGLGEPDID